MGNGEGVDFGEGGDYCRVVGDDDMLVSCDIGRNWSGKEEDMRIILYEMG